MTKQEATDAVNAAAMEHGPAFVIGLLEKFLVGSSIALDEAGMNGAYADALSAARHLVRAKASAASMEKEMEQEAQLTAFYARQKRNS